MYCPSCGADGVISDSNIIDTRLAVDGRSTTRRRVCKANEEHKFHTTESLRHEDLKDTFVRRASDKQITERYSATRLRRDLRTAVLGRLPDEEINQIIADIEGDLQERLAGLVQPLSVEEREHLSSGSYAAAIVDTDIRQATELRLRQASDRSVHVLYALGIRGRVDTPGRAGLRNAQGFLEWLYSPGAYSDLKRAIPSQPARPLDRWWPDVVTPHPTHVIKKSGEARAFGLQQFTNSIEMALVGRHRPVDNAQLVAAWVLAHLAGQRKVLSAQLSAGVTSTLRRVDDIAYLRWATVAKNFQSVREIADEAHDLVVRPSPRLVFDHREAPRTVPANSAL